MRTVPRGVWVKLTSSIKLHILLNLGYKIVDFLARIYTQHFITQDRYSRCPLKRDKRPRQNNKLKGTERSVIWMSEHEVSGPGTARDR